MSQRFNNLEDVYNTLTAQNFNWNSLPATNKYRKYAEWKRDPEKRKLPEGSSQIQGPRQIVTINPFGFDFDDTSQVKVTMSERAFNQRNNVGAAALYNHLTASTSAKKLAGFVPAKAVLSSKLGSPRSVTAGSNRITGRAYKTRTGETYTIPFGSSAEATKEFEVQEEILQDRFATHAVTFTPERLRRV
jgi:hypothetical protein